MDNELKEQLEDYIKELEKKKEYCDRWTTDEMIGMSSVYEEVILKLGNILS